MIANLASSRIVSLDQSSGDWSIALNSGTSYREDSIPDDQNGYDAAAAIALAAGGSVLTGSSGTNRMTVEGARNLIGLGTGVNYLVSQGQDTVVGSGLTYNDSPDTSSGAAYFATGTSFGTAFVTISGGGGLFNLGTNANIVDAAPVGSTINVKASSSVAGGSGSTILFDNAGGTGTVSGSEEDTVSASGNLVVEQGQNQVISVAGALGFLNGTGNTTLSGGANSTIWGAQGLALTADMSGSSIFVGNQPGTTGDQTIDASASAADLSYWSGPGTTRFIGGAGDDHLAFGTAFDGVAGESYATVTGGSGANSFGVLAGHTGGAITITDFNSAKGDFLFGYFYKPTNAAQSVQDLLSSATISGGNTTLQLDNNKTLTLLGVENLDSSAIVIS